MYSLFLQVLSFQILCSSTHVFSFSFPGTSSPHTAFSLLLLHSRPTSLRSLYVLVHYMSPTCAPNLKSADVHHYDRICKLRAQLLNSAGPLYDISVNGCCRCSNVIPVHSSISRMFMSCPRRLSDFNKSNSAKRLHGLQREIVYIYAVFSGSQTTTMQIT